MRRCARCCAPPAAIRARISASTSPCAGRSTARARSPASLRARRRSTSWDRVFRMLREQFPDERYHIGKELQRVEQTRRPRGRAFRRRHVRRRRPHGRRRRLPLQCARRGAARGEAGLCRLHRLARAGGRERAAAAGACRHLRRHGVRPAAERAVHQLSGRRPRQRSAARTSPLQFRLVSPGRRSDRAAAAADRRERARSTRSAFRRRWCARR